MIDLGTILTVIFFSTLTVATIYCCDGPKNITSMFQLFWVIAALSFWAVRMVPEYPIVSIALGDIAAACWILTRPRLQNWELAICFLFAVMIACHISYFVLINYTTDSGSFALYQWVLTGLFYGEIAITVFAQWKRDNDKVRFGKWVLANRVGIWAVQSREWYHHALKEKAA